MDPQKILDYGAKLIVIFMCIPIHEYAHAWAATKLGDDTPRYQGRLSLNPLAHLDPKRKRRIAAGSGTQVSDVNQLLKQFEQMQKMMKQFGIGGNLHGKKSRRNRAALLKGLGGGMPQ